MITTATTTTTTNKNDGDDDDDDNDDKDDGGNTTVAAPPAQRAVSRKNVARPQSPLLIRQVSNAAIRTAATSGELHKKSRK